MCTARHLELLVGFRLPLSASSSATVASDLMETAVVVVGIGADGWAGLDASRRTAVESADVVLGGERHLAMLPAEITAERRAWPTPLRDSLPSLLRRAGGPTRRRARVRATRSSPASARRWSTCSEPTPSRSSRPCRRSPSRGPGWAGPPRPSRSSATIACSPATWLRTHGSWCSRPMDPLRRKVARLLTEVELRRQRHDGPVRPRVRPTSRGSTAWPRRGARRESPPLNVVAVDLRRRVGERRLDDRTAGRRLRPRRPDHQARPAGLGTRAPGPGPRRAALGRRRRCRLDRDRVDEDASQLSRRRRRGACRSAQAHRGERGQARVCPASSWSRAMRPRRWRVSTRPMRCSSAAAPPSRACWTRAGSPRVRWPARRPWRHAGDRAGPRRAPRRARRRADPAARRARRADRLVHRVDAVAGDHPVVGHEAMTVHFVGAGPGAADLLTLRAVELLRRRGRLRLRRHVPRRRRARPLP